MAKTYGFEFSPEELWRFILFPLRGFGFLKFYVTKSSEVDKIEWEYKKRAHISPFSHRRVLSRDISRILAVCKNCGCELVLDFIFPIERTTSSEYHFDCPNCSRVYTVIAESLNQYRASLIRKLAHNENDRT